jgi:hypothetical protein
MAPFVLVVVDTLLNGSVMRYNYACTVLLLLHSCVNMPPGGGHFSVAHLGEYRKYIYRQFTYFPFSTSRLLQRCLSLPPMRTLLIITGISGFSMIGGCQK